MNAMNQRKKCSNENVKTMKYATITKSKHKNEDSSNPRFIDQESN